MSDRITPVGEHHEENGNGNGNGHGKTDEERRADVELLLEDIKRKYDVLTDEHAEIRGEVTEARNAVGVVNAICIEVRDTCASISKDVDLVRGSCHVLGERITTLDSRLGQIEREREAERVAHTEALAKLNETVGHLAEASGKLAAELAEVRRRDEQERDRRASLGEEAMERAALLLSEGKVQTRVAVQRQAETKEVDLAHEKRKAKLDVLKSVAIALGTGLAGVIVGLLAKGC